AGGALWWQHDQARQTAEEAARHTEEVQRLADRQRRHQLREQALATALAEARKLGTDLHERLSQPGGVFVLLNRPGEWQQLIGASRVALRRARDLQEAAEDPVSPALLGELTGLERLLGQDEADRDLALALEKIREDRSSMVQGQFNNAGSREAYSRLF